MSETAASGAAGDRQDLFTRMVADRAGTLWERIGDESFGASVPVKRVRWLRTNANGFARFLYPQKRGRLLCAALAVLAAAAQWADDRSVIYTIWSGMMAWVYLASTRALIVDRATLRPVSREGAGFCAAFTAATRIADDVVRSGTPGGREVSNTLTGIRPEYEQMLELLGEIDKEVRRPDMVRRPLQYREGIRSRRNEVGTLLVELTSEVLTAASILEANRPVLNVCVPATVQQAEPAQVSADLSRFTPPAATRERLTAKRAQLAESARSAIA